MSPRPPTLREKRRYILARVEPSGTDVEQKELYYAISEAVTSLWGDGMAAVVVPAVVAAEDGHVIVRCQRGTERELVIALSTVTACREAKLALRIVAASGTIESLRARIRKQRQPPPPDRGIPSAGGEGNEFVFAGKTFIAVGCEGAKVDVIEKGFKNANRLFLTTEDLEVS
ncbi:MAG TPA: Rpp14/Pop5 family protein [Methanoregula sp.]|nr:Rpp14/Pop5 family protein [Methanoregula sp.]